MARHFKASSQNKAVLFTLLLLWLAPAITAMAGDNTRQYLIPAQSLNNALMQFATDSHLELMFTAEKIRGLRADSLDGEMTPAQALSQLLQGSGMTYRFVDAKTVTIDAPSSNLIKTASTEQINEPQTDSEGQMMPKVTVEAEAENSYSDPNWSHDPYNKDYFRPKTTTATKIERSMMETPHSVQVVPRQLIEDRKITTIEEFTDNISGVQRFNLKKSVESDSAKIISA